MARGLTAALAAALLIASTGAQAQVELGKRDALRVCADANAMPFSNDKGEGFENKLAEMVAADLGVPVAYTWFPQGFGFVRNTLGARKCDIVMGTASGELLMQNTNPYYRSVYALVYRKDSGLTATKLSDPALKGARIGIMAQTPPMDLMVRYGLTNIEPYQLATDTRVYQPARDAVVDVATGKTDVAVIWGPLAAFWASKQEVPLVVAPLVEEAVTGRLSFLISMGIRPEEPDWKHWLNDWIKDNQPRIDALLASYGIPLLDREGKLIQPPPPEPEGYRKSDYRSPVPATLKGAAVLTTATLQKLVREKPDAVLLDVLPPQAPKPEGRPEGAAWTPRPHETIPGANWMPDVGHGDLTPAQESYFRKGLERLTGGDKARTLVVFCRRDCWMSWNAAKRALEWGYTDVRWYPDGVEGWSEARRPLKAVEPLDGGPQG